MEHSPIGEGEEQRRKLAEKLDAELDSFMDELAANKIRGDREKPFNFEEWCREIDQHPAFLTELKETDGGEYSAEVQAIQALKFDENDPAECAAAHKEEGNRHFANRKYRWAVGAYTKGIRLGCADDQLNSVLYSNRAAANRHLGNLRSAVRDCMFARRFQPDNFKAILRGAECLLELGQATICLEWIDTDAGNSAKMGEKQRKILGELREKAVQRRVMEERDGRQRRAKASVEKQQREALLDGLKRRGIRHRPPIGDLEDLTLLEVSFGQLDETISVHHSADQLVWPLLLQYPESGQTDFLKECPELARIDGLLGDVFESPAEWDAGHKFRFENVRLFIPLDGQDHRQERVREISPAEDTLATILSWPDVVIARGLPVIQVYTREYIRERLRPEGKRIFQFRNI